MAIPNFQYHVLPQGCIDATLKEVKERFCISDHRSRLCGGLDRFLAWVREMECFDALYVGGSFLTDKETPGDIDVMLKFSETPDASKFDAAICDKKTIEEQYGIDVTLFSPTSDDIREQCPAEHRFAATFSNLERLSEEEAPKVRATYKQDLIAQDRFDYSTFAGIANELKKGYIHILDF